MSRIKNAFSNGKALVAFVTGGDPDMETTEKLVLQISRSGADIIEIGIPFSDPVAEGVVIQAADERALKAGCTTDKLFDMVKSLRGKIDTPLLFMTYINPVFTYGKEKFLNRCVECGIDGIIVPDMPFEEKDELSEICEINGVDLISMIAPTSKSRAAMIAKEAKGFLYCVSSLGVTGVRSGISSEIKALIASAKDVSPIPCCIGFGISTPEQAKEMAKLSDGVIVGSAIVKIVAEHGRDSVPHVGVFVKKMKAAVLEA